MSAAEKVDPRTIDTSASAKYAVAIQELKDALGEQYVTDDPVIKASYSWKAHFGKTPTLSQFSDHDSVAITLPSTTEEVQAIVQICNRHGLKFSPSSTGHTGYTNVYHEDVISIDLRRMDYIEIDAENQMAVIGPYTTGFWGFPLLKRQKSL